MADKLSNSLSDAIANYETGTITRNSGSGTAGTFQSNTCYKVGKMVCIAIRLFGVSISPINFNLANIPSGFRPKANLTTICYGVINGNVTPFTAVIKTDGVINIPYSSGTSYTLSDITVCCTYPTP